MSVSTRSSGPKGCSCGRSTFSSRIATSSATSRRGARRSSPHSWGFTELELERDLLSIGKFGLRRAAGVFPDGTPFRMPDDDPLPAPIDIGAQVRDQIVYLAVPLRRAGAARRRSRGGRRTGWCGTTCASCEARDATSRVGRRRRCSKSARCGRGSCSRARSPRPMRACRSRTSSSAAPTSRSCSTTRSFRPCCDARAARRLATFMTELLGLLHQRGEALGGRVAATGRGAAAEIADFLMLQAINRYEPLLAHCADVGRAASRRSVPGLRGGGGRAGDVHDAVEAAAAARRLSARSAARVVRAGDRGAARVARARCSSRARFRFRSSRRSSASAWRRWPIARCTARRCSSWRRAPICRPRSCAGAFPAQLKIGPVEKIRDLVNLQLPGVPVHAVPVAPRQIPYHAGFVYFELDQTNELWGQLKSSGGVALHVAGEFPGLAHGVLGDSRLSAETTDAGYRRSVQAVRCHRPAAAARWRQAGRGAGRIPRAAGRGRAAPAPLRRADRRSAPASCSAPG